MTLFRQWGLTKTANGLIQSALEIEATLQQQQETLRHIDTILKTELNPTQSVKAQQDLKPRFEAWQQILAEQERENRNRLKEWMTLYEKYEGLKVRCPSGIEDAMVADIERFKMTLCDQETMVMREGRQLSHQIAQLSLLMLH